jgi:hypothetical protein
MPRFAQAPIKAKLATLKLSARGLKSHNTRCLNDGARGLAIAERAPPARHNIVMMEAHVEKIRVQFEKWFDNLKEQQQISYEDDYDSFEEKIDAENKRCAQLETNLLLRCAEIEFALRPTQAAQRVLKGANRLRQTKMGGIYNLRARWFNNAIKL